MALQGTANCSYNLLAPLRCVSGESEKFQITGALILSFFVSCLTIFGNFETCVTNHVFESEPGVRVWMR